VEVVKKVGDEHEGKIHFLVNNAAIAIPHKVFNRLVLFKRRLG